MLTSCRIYTVFYVTRSNFVFKLIIHPCADLVFTSDAFAKGRVTFYYCLFITALFPFLFIFIRACIFTSFYFILLYTACVHVCLEKKNKEKKKLYVRLILRDIFIAQEYDKKNVAKKDKASDCLKTFSTLRLCQSIVFFFGFAISGRSFCGFFQFILFGLEYI